ncbi:MAG TPA: alpha/beta fold hydrolase [Tepidiformaceae bacterium]|nr:alpha/beta fold hydrolase [Tepidiformaceae bacterium]
MMKSNALDPATDRLPDPLDIEIVDIAEARITLRKGKRRVRNNPAEPGQWGIEGARGYGWVGAVIETDGASVTREYRAVEGSVLPGDFVRLDTFAYPHDPKVALGLDFEDVHFDSPLGEMPAWLTQPPPERRGATWAILTHGKGANRRESLRILPTLIECGMPCLSITYRNDEGCPADPQGTYSYGHREWEDLEGAVRYAIDHGAAGVVLVGYSMGGAITVSFMAHSPLAAHVRGLILDAPMLDLEETIGYGAERLHIPRQALLLSNRVVGRWYGLEWAEVSYLARASTLNRPVLLFHGDADHTVPKQTSDALAAALTGSAAGDVTYIEVPLAGHVRAWNVDQPRYEAAVRDFVRRLD